MLFAHQKHTWSSVPLIHAVLSDLVHVGSNLLLKCSHLYFLESVLHNFKAVINYQAHSKQTCKSVFITVSGS